MFGFRDARRRPQLSGCLKALRQPERSGAVRLPASRGAAVRDGCQVRHVAELLASRLKSA
jgi:hypothetical protein